MNLTNRCNVECVHCYIRPQPGENQLPFELTTQRWLEILDEITEAGCLKFLITGGEPMLRSDFSTIYCHARQNGLVVTVFTNGTMITEKIMDLFDEFPPFKVEITLYGATASTYDRVTQVPGSYHRCMAGISRLQEHGINLGLKSVLIGPNAAEFAEIQRMAQDKGCNFRMDASMVSHISGAKDPLEFRIDPQHAVDVEFTNPKTVASWRHLYEQRKSYVPSKTAYTCNAGVSSFHIDAFGRLTICQMEKRWWHDLKTSSFREGWEVALPKIINRPAPKNDPCGTCSDALMCGCCKPQIALETGDETVPPAFMCDMARARREKIEELISQERGL
jgi:MoaA/NifB/PqqE/SkfB family radical SAM enzyme